MFLTNFANNSSIREQLSQALSSPDYNSNLSRMAGVPVYTSNPNKLQNLQNQHLKELMTIEEKAVNKVTAPILLKLKKAIVELSSRIAAGSPYKITQQDIKSIFSSTGNKVGVRSTLNLAAEEAYNMGAKHGNELIPRGINSNFSSMDDIAEFAVSDYDFSYEDGTSSILKKYNGLVKEINGIKTSQQQSTLNLYQILLDRYKDYFTNNIEALGDAKTASSRNPTRNQINVLQEIEYYVGTRLDAKTRRDLFQKNTLEATIQKLKELAPNDAQELDEVKNEILYQIKISEVYKSNLSQVDNLKYKVTTVQAIKTGASINIKSKKSPIQKQINRLAQGNLTPEQQELLGRSLQERQRYEELRKTDPNLISSDDQQFLEWYKTQRLTPLSERFASQEDTNYSQQAINYVTEYAERLKRGRTVVTGKTNIEKDLLNKVLKINDNANIENSVTGIRGKALSGARRIILTEIAALYNIGRLNAYLQAGITHVYIENDPEVTVRGNKTCVFCITRSLKSKNNPILITDILYPENRDPIKGKYKSLENWIYLPFHPWCRCWYMPAAGTEMTEEEAMKLTKVQSLQDPRVTEPINSKMLEKLAAFSLVGLLSMSTAYLAFGLFKRNEVIVKKVSKQFIPEESYTPINIEDRLALPEYLQKLPLKQLQELDFIDQSQFNTPAVLDAYSQMFMEDSPAYADRLNQILRDSSLLPVTRIQLARDLIMLDSNRRGITDNLSNVISPILSTFKGYQSTFTMGETEEFIQSVIPKITKTPSYTVPMYFENVITLNPLDEILGFFNKKFQEMTEGGSPFIALQYNPRLLTLTPSDIDGALPSDLRTIFSKLEEYSSNVDGSLTQLDRIRRDYGQFLQRIENVSTISLYRQYTPEEATYINTLKRELPFSLSMIDSRINKLRSYKNILTEDYKLVEPRIRANNLSLRSRVRAFNEEILTNPILSRVDNYLNNRVTLSSSQILDLLQELRYYEDLGINISEEYRRDFNEDILAGAIARGTKIPSNVVLAPLQGNIEMIQNLIELIQNRREYKYLSELVEFTQVNHRRKYTDNIVLFMSKS